MAEIKILAVWLVIYFMSDRILLRAVAGNLYLTVTVTLYSSDILFVGALCIKYVNWGYQNNDQSVSIIPKWDSWITNFSIPDPRIEIPIPGL